MKYVLLILTVSLKVEENKKKESNCLTERSVALSSDTLAIALVTAMKHLIKLLTKSYND